MGDRADFTEEVSFQLNHEKGLEPPQVRKGGRHESLGCYLETLGIFDRTGVRGQ